MQATSHYLNQWWPTSLIHDLNQEIHWGRDKMVAISQTDETFNHIFVNENVRISIKFSLKFVPKGPINNIPALIQIMAWRHPGGKPLSEPMRTQFNDAYMRHSGLNELTYNIWESLWDWQPAGFLPQIAKFMGLTWGPPGCCRPQMGPMLSPWTLLSGTTGGSIFALWQWKMN